MSGGNHLGRINGGPAANGQHAIARVVTAQFQASFDNGECRVRDDTVEDRYLASMCFQKREQTVQHAVLQQETVSHQKRAFVAGINHEVGQRFGRSGA